MIRRITIQTGALLTSLVILVAGGAAANAQKHEQQSQPQAARQAAPRQQPARQQVTRQPARQPQAQRKAAQRAFGQTRGVQAPHQQSQQQMARHQQQQSQQAARQQQPQIARLHQQQQSQQMARQHRQAQRQQTDRQAVNQQQRAGRTGPPQRQAQNRQQQSLRQRQSSAHQARNQTQENQSHRLSAAQQESQANRAQPLAGRGGERSPQVQAVRTGRFNQFRQSEPHRLQLGTQVETRLRQQHRTAHLRFEQDYVSHIRGNGGHEFVLPLFYTAPRYRCLYGGGYIVLDAYAADSLRQAVQLGYQEGFRAGQADREDRYRFDYAGSFAYQDATYGYGGYTELGAYQYYFRRGFVHGYEDGYYGRYQYGVYRNGVATIVAASLNGIFNPRPY